MRKFLVCSILLLLIPSVLSINTFTIHLPTGSIGGENQLSYTFGVGDLDGDGDYDYLIRVWKENDDNIVGDFDTITYAYTNTGNYLWKFHHNMNYNDVGGDPTWIVPLSAWDIDGDGKDEVITQVEEGGDYKMVILDGETGSIQRSVSIDHPRTTNQQTIAFLDGSQPYIVRAYGNPIKIVAYDRNLNEHWTYNGPNVRNWNNIYTFDVDGDGKDEIVNGPIIVDNDGSLYLDGTSFGGQGIGHTERSLINDIVPSNPGLEWYFARGGQEPGHKMTEPASWKGSYLIDLDQRSVIWHHSGTSTAGWGRMHRGWIADVYADKPGLEMFATGYYYEGNEWQNILNGMYGTPPGNNDVWVDGYSEKYFIYSSDGTVLQKRTGYNVGYPVYWDDDSTAEYFQYRGGILLSSFEGGQIESGLGHAYGSGESVEADIFGDWREEILIGSGTKFYVHSNDASTSYPNRCSPTSDHNYLMNLASIGTGLPKPLPFRIIEGDCGSPRPPPPTPSSSFMFAVWSDFQADNQDDLQTTSKISDHIATLDPEFTISPGDLERSGFTSAGISDWKRSVNGIYSGGSNDNGLSDITFPVRGNHDQDEVSSWQSHFNIQSIANSAGAKNYRSLSGKSDLVYSFDYKNSHFVGLDVTGTADKLTSDQITWLDSDLSSAESRGLTHAFIFFHGPLYCVGRYCEESCTGRVCPLYPEVKELVDVLNKHSLVTATFHGHVHIGSYTKLDSSRIPELTTTIHQFVSPSAGPFHRTCDRSDRWEYCMDELGFYTVEVDGDSVKVSWYNQDKSLRHRETVQANSGSPPPSDTCSSKDGYTCIGDKICAGQVIQSSSSGTCCSIQCETVSGSSYACTPMPLSFDGNVGAVKSCTTASLVTSSASSASIRYQVYDTDSGTEGMYRINGHAWKPLQESGDGTSTSFVEGVSVSDLNNGVNTVEIKFNDNLGGSTRGFDIESIIITLNDGSPSSCSDTDGRNYNVKGTLTENGAVSYDACQDTAQLIERWCDGTTAKQELYTCTNGCTNGACAVDIPPTQSEGDVDGNLKVGINDLIIVAQNFGSSNFDPRADVNGDGKIDITDLIIVAQNFGRNLDDSPPPPSDNDVTTTLHYPYAEWSFNNPSWSGNPFDLNAQAQFSDNRKPHMFYDGGTTWKLRYQCTDTGTFTFTTSSSDSDLNDITGSVTCTSHSGAMGRLVAGGKNDKKFFVQGWEKAIIPAWVMIPDISHKDGPESDSTINTWIQRNIDRSGFLGAHAEGPANIWYDWECDGTRSDCSGENPDPETFRKFEELMDKLYDHDAFLHIWAFGDCQRDQCDKFHDDNTRQTRLRHYFADRWGAIPNWMLSEGFDNYEDDDVSYSNKFYRDIHDRLAWDHLIGVRSYSTDLCPQCNYESWENVEMTYDKFRDSYDSSPDRPVFEEDRFRYRQPDLQFREKDLHTTDDQHDHMWWQAMVGGVAAIYGDLGDMDYQASNINGYPDEIHNVIKIWHEFWYESSKDNVHRFMPDMERCNGLTNGYGLCKEGSYYVFYKEDTSQITFDISSLLSSAPAIAMDTWTGQVIDLGTKSSSWNTFDAPHNSDWVVAVGHFT